MDSAAETIYRIQAYCLQMYLKNEYKLGDGVPDVDYHILRVLEKGMESDNSLAFLILGWLYERGFCVEKNQAKAIAFYRRGAELDYARETQQQPCDLCDV